MAGVTPGCSPAVTNEDCELALAEANSYPDNSMKTVRSIGWGDYPRARGVEEFTWQANPQNRNSSFTDGSLDVRTSC